MLQITDQATIHLLHARTEYGFGKTDGARFVRSSTGIGLTFAATPQEGDQVLVASALPIYVADEVSAALDRAVIDVTADNGEPRLVLRPQGEG
jgi:hypothetical protein